MVRKPAQIMQGIAIMAMRPSRHSAIRAMSRPQIIVERLMVRVDTTEETMLFTCFESMPKRVAASPPRFYIF